MVYGILRMERFGVKSGIHFSNQKGYFFVLFSRCME